MNMQSLVNFIQRNQKAMKKTRARKCPECLRGLIKFGGTTWNSSTGETTTFTVGRLCRFCEIFFINPKFKDVKIIYSSIGGKEINLQKRSGEKIVL